MTAPLPLTRRERDIAPLLMDGLDNRTIGRRLSISEDTVKSHVKSILRKTGTTNRTAAADVLRRSLSPANPAVLLAPLHALMEAAPRRLDCRFAVAGAGVRVLIDLEELRQAVHQVTILAGGEAA